MKSLKKKVKRLLSLFVVAAVVMVSVPQEYLMVRAAEISEDSMEFDVPESEENDPLISESVETKTEQDQPAAETKETQESAPVPEETQMKETQAQEGSTTTEGQTTVEAADSDETTGTQETESATEESKAEETETGEAVTSEAEETTSETEETSEIQTTETETTQEVKLEVEDNTARAGGVPEIDKSQILAEGDGYSGDVKWVLDQNGTLEVTGTGECCKDNTFPPWNSYKSRIKAARINVKGATLACNLFNGCENLTKIDLSGFETDNITAMYRMFQGCSSLTSEELNASLKNINTSKVTSMSYMFLNCSSLTDLDLSAFNTTSVTNMFDMFDGCSSLTNLDLSTFNTTNVVNMSYMFDGCRSLTDLNLNFNIFSTSNVTNMSCMFRSCSSLTELDLSTFDISNVTGSAGILSMFQNCSSLTDLNLKGWNFAKATDIAYLFNGCKSLTNLNLTDWNTSNITRIENMFGGCESLKNLDLSSLDLSKVTSGYGYSNWLKNNNALESIICPAKPRSGIELPVREGNAWRDSTGKKLTLLPTSDAFGTISRNKMAGIEFLGENFTLQDASGNSLDLVVSTTESGTLGEKIVDLGSKDSFIFTVVPDTDYTIKNVELVSGNDSTLVLEKGKEPNQYTISPLDKESGYTKDEAVKVEITPVADNELSITYDKNIEDTIVINGAKEEKGKPKTIQVSNDSETRLYVKINNSNTTDPQDPIIYLTPENGEKQLITHVIGTGDMSDTEKTLIEEGYHIFRLGSLYEDTFVEVTSRYLLSDDDIASGIDGDVSWVINKDGRLKIKGIGNLAYAYSGYYYPAWYEYRDQITSAVVDWTGATSVSYMFYGCTNLEDVDLSGFDVSGITSLTYMFYNCESLTSLDLGGMDAKNITDMAGMFAGCTSLTEIKTPRNVNYSVSLPSTDGKWRLPDGTAITELPQNEAESITIDTHRAAITIYGENYTIKDADGNTVAGKPYGGGNAVESELLVTKGTKEAVTFTAEPSEGYVVRKVWATAYTPTIAVTAGAVSGQYTISPLDMEKGFVNDETIRIETTAVESYTMNINYYYCIDNIADVIIVNGDVSKEGKPTSVAVSNAYDTSMYLKVGEMDKSGTWIPKISVRSIGEDGNYYDKTLSYQNDKDDMSAKEKELAQQGYFIYHLGKLYGSTDVTVGLTAFYEARFTTTGFPGNVRIVRYMDDGYDSDTGKEKWIKEEIKDTIVVEDGTEIYLQAEWEDTPDYAYKWCRAAVSAESNVYTESITLDGIEGEVQRIRIYENTAIQISLKPHTIALEYSMGDLTDISTGNGAALSEDCSFLEVYSGNDVSLSFGLLNGLQLSEAMDNTGVRWSAQEKDGRYTVTFHDMAMLYDITTLRIEVLDPKNRTSLSDPEANCQVSLKFKNTKGSIPVYTGEPIEAATMTVRATALNYNNQKPRTMTLRKDKDFTVSYVDNINAGKAMLIITAMPDSQYFRGSYVYPFTIAKAESPKGIYKSLQVESMDGQYTHQINLSELFKIEQAEGKVIIPTGYRLVTPCDKGEVLIPDEEPTLEGNILTYTMRDDANKSSLLAHLSVIASFDNYEDCELQINIQAVKKEKLVLGGTVIVSDKEYDGKEVSPNIDGLQILSIEGTNEPASAELLNEIKNALSYHYTGVDGTIYDSDNAPIDTGTYKVQVKVSEDMLDYKSDYMEIGSFSISRRNVRVIADDVKLYLDDTLTVQYSYHTDGLAEGDVVSTKSFVSCGIQSTAEPAEYPVTVDISAVKIANPTGKDVTANYIITGQDGKLVVCEPEPGSCTVTYTRLDPLDPLNLQKDIKRSGNEVGKLIEKPIDPEADGYVFLGWYTDETSSREWNFNTDIIQSDITLYAGWSKCAAEGEGIALCVQEILPQTYTGKAVKPTVVVYAADGKTRLKLKTDYTITYKNNTNADTKAFPDEVPEGGIGEGLSDTGQGFNSKLPYVIITGKGNYTGKVYVNFHINPADVCTAELPGSGFALKYTDQLEEKPGRNAAIVTQFKYKNKGLKYGTDYILTVKKVESEGDAPVFVTLNAKGQIPLAAGRYQFTIEGKGNYTGSSKEKTVYIADKTKLLKNAKVTGISAVSNVTKEQLINGVGPDYDKLEVKLNNNVLVRGTDYEVECTDNHAVGTAILTVTAKEGSGYIGSKMISFKIKGAAFKANALQLSGWQDTMSYTGKALTQNGVVLKTTDGRELIYGEDYTVSYKNNVRKGTAAMVFTAKPSSGYSGSFTRKFKITPMDLSTAINEDLILVNGAVNTGSRWRLNESVPYQKGGVAAADRISLQLRSTGTILAAGKGKDYTVTYTNNKTVSNGTAYMTLKGSGNYTGSIDISFDITIASLLQSYQEGTVTITSESIKVKYPYSGHWEDDGDGGRDWIEDDLKNSEDEFKPAITIKDGKTALKKGVDFTVEYSGNTRSDLEGSDVLRATIRGMGNYGGDDEEIELDISVNRRALSAKKVQIDYENEFTYTGEQITPSIGAVSYKTFNGRGKEDDDDYEPPEWDELTEGQDYRVEYTKNIAKGTGTLKIIGIGRYTGSLSKSFKIISRAIYNKPQQSDDPEEDF